MRLLIYLFIFFFKINFSIADNKITYIDINFILTNSLVGKSINAHIKKIQDENMQKFNDQEKVFIKKEKKLLSQKNILEKNEFEKKLSILNEEVAKYRITKKNKLNELNKEKINYTKEVLNYLNPIITNFVEKNSVTLVLPKKNIIVGKKDLDITEEILILLDNKIKEIKY